MTIVSSQGVINWHSEKLHILLLQKVLSRTLLFLGGSKWYLIQDWSGLDKLQMSFRVSMQFTVLFSDLLKCLPSVRSRIICEKRSRNRQSTDTQDKHDLFSSLIHANKRRSWYGCAYGWRTHRFINCQLGTIWAEDIFVGNILIFPGGWVRGLVTQDSLKKVCLIHVVPDDCTHILSFTFASLSALYPDIV